MTAAPQRSFEPAAFDATTDAGSLDVSLEATVAAPSSAVMASGSTSGSAAVHSSRTTVLPRLEASSGQPQLVRADRPRYERQALLGAGGVGEVVKTIDNDIDRVVAVKRLRADMRSAGHLARFVEEIRTIGLLEHPNIVPIHDVGVDEEGQYFFVMKYVEGETLESVLDKLGKGDPLYHARYGFERRVEIVLGILEAVAYAHARGIIHRDLKPANVMIGPFGEVMVMDWGLARRIDGRGAALDPVPGSASPASGDPFETRAGSLLGTPAYMSPEQARGEKLDVRSDIYALSVMFHEMLCLEHYLEKCTTLPAVLAAVQSESPRAPSFVSHPHQSGAPMDLSHFVRKGYEKDPSRRYQSVEEMIQRLRRRAEGYIPIQCHVTFLKRMTTAWTHLLDRRPFLVTGLMLLFVAWAVASTVWLALSHG
jgi:serine/threonine-protein kinase